MPVKASVTQMVSCEWVLVYLNDCYDSIIRLRVSLNLEVICFFTLERVFGSPSWRSSAVFICHLHSTNRFSTLSLFQPHRALRDTKQ